MRVLITGAAGRIGRVLTQALQERYTLRCADIEVPDADAADWIACDLTDPGATARAVENMDAVVHLAGHPNAMDWETVRSVNETATLNVLQACANAGVRRFVYASSVHVCGLHPADAILSPELPVWPDSPYGVSKAVGEMHLRYFVDLCGMTGIAMRICSFRPEPTNARELATWISPRDMVLLAEACLSADLQGFHTVWGVSANSRANIDKEAWDRIGYEPEDDSSDHIARLAAEGVDVSAFSEWPLLGGAFVDRARASQVGLHPHG